jgi:hypothetical protein
MVVTKRNPAWNKVLQEAETPLGQDQAMESTFWSTRRRLVAAVFDLGSKRSPMRAAQAVGSKHVGGNAQ